MYSLLVVPVDVLIKVMHYEVFVCLINGCFSSCCSYLCPLSGVCVCVSRVLNECCCCDVLNYGGCVALKHNSYYVEICTA